MPKIFISYRRNDAAYAAQAIYHELVAQFGEADVFFDRKDIPEGTCFPNHIKNALRRCDMLLAIIGDHWLNAQGSNGQRRLDDTNDLVRKEIETGLSSRNITVIPVLVGQAVAPHAEELPPQIKNLSKQHAAEVRAGSYFQSDLEKLVRILKKYSLGLIKPFDIINCSNGMKLKLIPAGKFTMGSADSDETAGVEETPPHNVKITQPFFLGVYPVTQAEYLEVLGTNPSDFSGNDRRPVDCVTWLDAVVFCNTLSEVERLQPCYRINGESVSIVGESGYRLPTEAEWEYACRAGTTTKWSFGDDESQLMESAWYASNSAEFRWITFDNVLTTHPVGEKQPNPWGLHDMHGNVIEWCWDWYDENYYKHSPANDPMGPTAGDDRILRGGSFGDDAWVLRSANRARMEPLGCSQGVGFRVAMTQPAIPKTTPPPIRRKRRKTS